MLWGILYVHTMKRYMLAIVLLIFLGLSAAFVLFMQGHTIAVLEPKGPIGEYERTLILRAVVFMLIVITPVVLLAFFIAWRYRAQNTKAAYKPNWEHSKMNELVWWAIPFEVVLVLGALTWTSTHALDPRKPIAAAEAPMVIRVVALDWKWLFIYPEERIATVNFVEFPVNRPVEFQITADAPMNSFWIPELGGQIYAMTGMVTTLHLMADEIGDFAGGSSNYSGDGFAQMKFIARASLQEEFDKWVKAVRQSPRHLTAEEYNILRKPSVADAIAYYGSVDPSLYASIVAQFTDPITTHGH